MNRTQRLEEICRQRGVVAVYLVDRAAEELRQAVARLVEAESAEP